MKASTAFASVATLIATVFFIVALSTGDWSSISQVSYKTFATNTTNAVTYISVVDKVQTFAPFKACQNNRNLCSDIWSIQDGIENARLKVTRSFTVLAVILSGLALAGFSFSMKSNSFEGLSGLFSLGAAICGIISMAVWTSIHKHLKDNIASLLVVGDSSVNYGFSFGLEIVAWSLCFVAAMLSVVSSKSPSDSAASSAASSPSN